MTTTNRQLAESIVKQLVNCDDPEWFIRQTEHLIATHVQEATKEEEANWLAERTCHRETLAKLTTTQTALRLAVGALEALPLHHAHNCLRMSEDGKVVLGECVCDERVRTKAIAAGCAALKE